MHTKLLTESDEEQRNLLAEDGEGRKSNHFEEVTKQTNQQIVVKPIIMSNL